MRMEDIARLARVSIATVSRVINNPEKVRPETRERIFQIMEENHFVANAVARGLVTNSMQTVGVLTVDIRDLYFANLTYTIERQFNALGYNVILCNTGGEPEEKKRYLRLLLEKQMDGLILVGSVFKEVNDNRHILDAGRRLPVVLVNSALEGPNLYAVVCDDTAGVREAVQRLYELGHREIYYFCDIRSYSGLAKVEGFTAGMRQNGLNPGNVRDIPRSITGAREGVKRLLAEKKPFTAIITGEDLTAIGVIRELAAANIRVPEEVSVVGYNNSILGEVTTPSLTSIDSQNKMMATKAVQILYGVLQGKPVPTKTVLTPTLIMRESVGKVQLASSPVI